MTGLKKEEEKKGIEERDGREGRSARGLRDLMHCLGSWRGSLFMGSRRGWVRKKKKK